MPSYNVIAKGFYGGKTYDPQGKRRVLDVDKPFNKATMPSWVEPIKEVSPSQPSASGVSAKELKVQLDALGVEYRGNASREVLQSLLDEAENDAQNKRDIDAAVNFQVAPSSSGTVETL